jgi:hypothetical protein
MKLFLRLALLSYVFRAVFISIFDFNFMVPHIISVLIIE